MSLQRSYIESKGRDITTPIPDTPGYTPPVVPTPQKPIPGSVPNIPRPTFSGTSTTVTLYNCTAEDRVCNKASYLTQIFSGDVTIKDQCDLIDPVIYLNASTSIINCNYMQAFDRYYFIREKTLIKGDLYAIHAHEDVLYTYNSQIRTQEGVIARQENKYNLYLDDEKYKVTGQVIERTLKFSKTPLTKNLQYVLLTTGGRGSLS